MIGFMLPIFCLGLFAIGWPLYLHLRNQRQEIQIIPSLRILSIYSKRQKKRSYDNLILLICRVLFTIAIVLLISQPFIETTNILPLPPVAGEMESREFLGVLIDDSIYSYARKDYIQEFENDKEWLIDQLDTLPRSTRVSLCFSSYPTPSNLMTVESAIEVVEKCAPGTQKGYAEQALSELINELKGKPARLLVIAPRFDSLWKQVLDQVDKNEAVNVIFRDTTPETKMSSVPEVTFSQTKDSVDIDVTLAGPQSALTGSTLSIVDTNNKLLVEKRLSANQVFEKRYKTTVPQIDEQQSPLSISINTTAPHPWQTYFINPKVMQATQNSVLIVRNQTRPAITADKIMSAAILVNNPEVHIDHLDFTRISNSKTPLYSTVIVIGASSLPGNAQQWYDKLLQNNTRILFIPLEQNNKKYSTHHIVSWELPAPKRNHKVAKTADDLNHILSLMPVENMDSFLMPTVMSAKFTTFDRPVFQTIDELTVVSRSVVGESTLWAFGFPLNFDTNSPVMHPMFPLIVNTLLFSDPSVDIACNDIVTGTPMELHKWFNADKSIKGTLTSPDGKKLTIPITIDTYPFSPDKAGVYTFKQNDLEYQQVVNIPRMPSSNIMSKHKWETQHEMNVVWATDRLSIAETDTFSIESLAEQQKYDLSAFAAAALLLFLLMEELTLLTIWRKKR